MLHAPYEAVKGCSAEVSDVRSSAANLVQKWDRSFPARAAKIKLQALGWIASADSDLAPTAVVEEGRSSRPDESSPHASLQ